jgi:hypothetical protein
MSWSHPSKKLLGVQIPYPSKKLLGVQIPQDSRSRPDSASVSRFRIRDSASDSASIQIPQIP